MISGKKKLSFWLSIGISILILWYLCTSLEWKEVASILGNVRWYYLVLWILVFFLALLIRAYRWKLLFSKSLHPSFRHLYDSLNVGNLATMVLPLRAGEFIRPLLFSKWNGVSFGKSFASVVIERVFDVCGMFLIFLYAVKGIGELPEIVLVGSRILSTVAGIIGFSMLISYLIPKQIVALIEYISNISKKLLPSAFMESCESSAKEFVLGLSGIENLLQLLLISVSTVVIWILYVIGFQILFLSLDGAPGDSFAIAAVTCVFVSLFIAAPSAPGFLGTFQLGCVAALTGVFSYSEEFSIAFSIVAHSMQFFITILLGLLSMFFQGLRLSNIHKTSL